MSCSQPDAWVMVSANEVEARRVWTDYSNISSKHYSKSVTYMKNTYVYK